MAREHQEDFPGDLEASELLREMKAVGADGGKTLALGDAELRALHPEEIVHLRSQGNEADDWQQVQVAVGFDWRRVRNCNLHGSIVLGRFDWRVPLDEGCALPSGLYGSTLVDCVIGHDALVRDVNLLAGYVVGPGAVLLDCGSITCADSTAFGNNTIVSLGIETGGREVSLYAEMTLEEATRLVRSRADRDLLECHQRQVAAYAACLSQARGVIGRGAVVRHSARLRNTYVGPFAQVDGAATVAASTLLSSEEHRTRVASGACLDHALLQPGSQVATHAVVERSLLAEGAGAERHARVTNSFIAQGTVIHAGEVTASLVGPAVGFHHLALLIATLWPEGRGNVSHGANAGSNHTGRAPDQEFWPGEGTFLGLGVNIKFPANYTRSPYSLIACGVAMLPQKIEFPFALINKPTAIQAEVPAGFNEIVPGWMLSENLYAVKRRELRYRVTDPETPLFRPAIIAMMRIACQRLEGVAETRALYTDRQIRGLGKNYLLDSSRRAAIDAYRTHIRAYALLGLLDAVEQELRRNGHGAVPELLLTPAAASWEYQRRILYDDFGYRDPLTALQELPELFEQFARDVERSKAKDDERGSAIIDDYREVHPAIEQDPIVQAVRQEAAALHQRVEAVLSALDTTTEMESWTILPQAGALACSRVPAGCSQA